MGKFEVGDTIEVIKEFPQDKYWGITIGMIGNIKEKDKFDPSRYIVDFPLHDKKGIPMIASQMKKNGSSPSPDNTQEIKFSSIGEVNLSNCLSGYVKIDSDGININSDSININVEKEKNNMKILELYRERKFSKIQNDFFINKNKILEEDEIQKIFKEMINQVNVILENEGSKPVDMELPVQYKEFRTAKTNEKLHKLEVETDMLKDKIYSDYEEVKAMLSMTNDYQEQIEILKNYGIIDKKTKRLNV